MTNDLRGNGCLCQGCGRRYKVDINVSDELWERLQNGDEERDYKRPNLLCGICIMRRIELLGEFDYYNLVYGSLSE